MKNYEFIYTVTPNKENADWWCDIRDIHFECEAENLNEAKECFQYHLDSKWSVEISKTALKNPSKMYRDRKGAKPEVVGYVFNASHEVQFEKGWRNRYCWVWTEIREFSIVADLP